MTDVRCLKWWRVKRAVGERLRFTFKGTLHTNTIIEQNSATVSLSHFRWCRGIIAWKLKNYLVIHFCTQVWMPKNRKIKEKVYLIIPLLTLGTIYPGILMCAATGWLQQISRYSFSSFLFIIKLTKISPTSKTLLICLWNRQKEF